MEVALVRGDDVNCRSENLITLKREETSSMVYWESDDMGSWRGRGLCLPVGFLDLVLGSRGADP